MDSEETKLNNPGETIKFGENPCVLAVEGKEEVFFFDALLRHLNLQDVIQIYPTQGKTNLRDKLDALRLSPDFHKVKALGVIRDADQDATYAFHSIRNDLQAVRLPVPEVLETLVGHNPRVGVMLLPGGNRIGMLEDLCLDSIAQDSVFLHCVTKYFQCLEQQGIVLRDNVISKAKIQVFLASREKPGLRLGEAAGKGYWPWDNQVFEPLKVFLQQMAEGI